MKVLELNLTYRVDDGEETLPDVEADIRNSAITYSVVDTEVKDSGEKTMCFMMYETTEADKDLIVRLCNNIWKNDFDKIFLREMEFKQNSNATFINYINNTDGLSI